MVALGPVGGHGVLERSASILCPNASKSIIVKPGVGADMGADFDLVSIKRDIKLCCIAGR